MSPRQVDAAAIGAGCLVSALWLALVLAAGLWPIVAPWVSR